MTRTCTRLCGGFLSLAVLASTGTAGAAMRRQTVGGSFGGTSFLPTGVYVTPTAAQGSHVYRLSTGLRADGNADGGDATATALSPDGKTLLVLTSGYNQGFSSDTGAPLKYNVPNPVTGAPSTTLTTASEWVFVYDVRRGAPERVQMLSIPNTYDGLAWAPSGKDFYVSGGIDDRVLVYAKNGRSAAGADTFAASVPAAILGHNTNDTSARPTYDGGLLKGTPAGTATKGALTTGAVAADIAVSADGRTLAVANMENDSLSIVDAASRNVVKEVRFTMPGSNRPRGEFPYGVAIKSDASGAAETAYVSSLRENQVLAVDVVRGAVVAAIPVGSGPNNMVLSADGTRLYVADGNSDDVAVIDTRHNRTIALVPLGGRDPLHGRNPNGLALAPGGQRLYVTLGGENALAVVDLQKRRMLGKIPTGWYPTGVTTSKDGKLLYIVNEKSVPGPNPANGRTTPYGLSTNPTGRNEYGWALEKAGLAVVPVPGDESLEYLAQTVDANNGVANRRDDGLRALRGRIKHVIYIVKENRTYDQVFGDLPNANGDPRLALFPKPVTPNHHALASGFVTLDNFYDPGESSGVGWNWSVGAQTNDYVERSQAVLYGNANFSGLTYDYEGTARNINLAFAQTGGTSPFDVRETGLFDQTGRSSILPGPRNPAAFEGDGDLDRNELGGYLWDEALRRGLAIRNYGFFADLAYYTAGQPAFIPISRTPYASHVPQSPITKTDLGVNSDPYFRGFDNVVPDTFRYEEWAREYDAFVKNRNLPNLEFVRIMHDHFGSFGSAIEGLNTPQTQMADNDYALGKIVERVSHSPYWDSTAIFVLEDDPQDGPDHVDMHRSLALVASPYVRRGAVIHADYTTDNVLKSIEQILGMRPLGVYDGNAEPMTDVFTNRPDPAPYDALVPASLCAPPVSPNLLGDACQHQTQQQQFRPQTTKRVVELHDGAWWNAMTANMDFSAADRVDPHAFNAVLWYGMTGTIAPDSAAL